MGSVLAWDSSSGADRLNKDGLTHRPSGISVQMVRMGWLGLSHYMVSHPPGALPRLLQMVVSVPRSKTGQFPKHKAFQASVCFLFLDVQLAKASHMTKPNF